MSIDTVRDNASASKLRLPHGAGELGMATRCISTWKRAAMAVPLQGPVR